MPSHAAAASSGGVRKFLLFERVHAIFLWYSEGKAKVTLGLTTVLIAASGFLLALVALISVMRDRGQFATSRDFEKLLDEFDEWKDHIRVAIGRASRLKRD